MCGEGEGGVVALGPLLVRQCDEAMSAHSFLTYRGLHRCRTQLLETPAAIR